MDFKSDHFANPNLSGLRTGASTSPLTVGGGDMPMQLSRPGGAGSLALDRRKQINTLLIFNENVSEIVPNEQYRMDFTGGGTSGPLIMYINLPQGFPKERPTIRIEPLDLHHPWLDARNGNVIGSPGLNSFSIHSDLGRVVQVVKREFERNPPTNHIPIQPANQPTRTGIVGSGWLKDGNGLHLTQTNPCDLKVSSVYSYRPEIGGRLPYPLSTNPAQYPVAVGSHTSRYFNHDFNAQNQIGTRYSSTLHNGPATTNTHTGNNVIEEVAALTDAELEELNENKSALLKFCQNLDNPIMHSMDKKYEEVKDEVGKTAEENETLTTALRSKRESLVEQQQQYKNIRTEYESLRIRVENAKTIHSVTNLSKILEASSLADEDESEKCADDFLNGGSSVERFIKDYTAIRTSHIKKIAKLDSVMRQRNTELKQTSTYIPPWPKY